MTAAVDGGFAERMARVEALIRELEEARDPVARERSRELVRALLDVHAAGLTRMVEMARAHEGPAADLVQAWAGEGTISSLLLLHGLHPTPLALRVRAALEEIEPKVRGMGARVFLQDATGEAVHLRLEVGGGCGSNPAGVRAVVEDALCAAAPDAALEFEVVEAEPVPQGFVPLAQLVVRRA
jgi:Fe-S cluster biogenesis protein NfuA